MRYVACRLAYHGASFHGSQRQKNAYTVQEALEDGIEKLCGHPARVTLAGRTDSGVHALGQCFSFATSATVPLAALPRALNANLDKNVRVGVARQVDEQFHPRFSALSRTYRYWIDVSEMPCVLLQDLAVPCADELNLVQMQRGAAHFVGRHDFAAWQSAGSPASGTVRYVQRMQVRRRFDVFGSALIEIEVQAHAFLYRMVRNMVGTLMEIGRGKLAPEMIPELMRGRDRRQCPPPAPPQGLCLMNVEYSWKDF